MNASRKGLIYGLGAYVAWGIFPIYFKALHAVAPLEVLAHRILWSALFLAGLVTLRRRGAEYLAALRAGRLAVYALSTSLITANWLIFIWGVAHGKVLEASLGYFITPIVSVILGRLVLGETMRPLQIVAVVLAAAGVLVLIVRLGTVPWLALGLAASFGSYGLVRKKAGIDPLVGLLVETSLLAPLAALIIFAHAVTGTGALGASPALTALLLLAGVLTSVPLIWFAHGVSLLRLSTMGLLQYITPTLQFLLAVLLFHEPFTPAHAAAFGCIWVALGLYSVSAVKGQPDGEGGASPRLALEGDGARVLLDDRP
jgi:chloramphenicol-sensitive protein RarD